MNNNTIYIHNKVSVKKKNKKQQQSVSQWRDNKTSLSFLPWCGFFFPFYRHTKRIWEVQCSCPGIMKIKLPTSQKSLVYPPPSRWLYLTLNSSPSWQGCALSEPELNDRYWLFMWKTHVTRVCLIQKLKGLKRCALFWVWHWTKIAEKTTEEVGGKVALGESCPAPIKLENLIGSRARRIS